ncbi:MAG TPA: hypothetical protein H9687_05860 [Firmicutes bacterium]|nr:hypothetical protein [Bacillota bacterium]
MSAFLRWKTMGDAALWKEGDSSKGNSCGQADNTPSKGPTRFAKENRAGRS